MCRVISAKGYTEAKADREAFIERPRVKKISRPTHMSEAITTRMAKEHAHENDLNPK